MKNEIRFTLESKQRPKLAQEIETYLEQHRIMNGYQAAHMILQDTDWIKRVYCISQRSRRNSERPDSAVTRAWVSGRCGNNGRSDSRLWTFDCEGQAEWGDMVNLEGMDNEDDFQRFEVQAYRLSELVRLDWSSLLTSPLP